MAKQVEAQLHEESKFCRASKPFPNRSSMQGRESEKKSNSQQFRMAMRNTKRSTSCRTESKTLENEFHILCEISQALKWISKPLAKFSQALRNQNWGKSISHPVRNFASIVKSSCVIFRYFCTDSVRFLSQDILCNYLFSHCNQLKIFLDI